MAATPSRIGRYLVREVIGAGAFATVYRATDERFGGDVALKVLAENHSLDPDVRERFIEEGRRMRRCRNPHLVVVHDLDETERAQPYLVMEWADRGDLDRRVAEAHRRGLGAGPGDVVVVARAMTAALHALHAQHLVHRDLTPKNLLLTSTARPPNGHTAEGGSARSEHPLAVRILAPDETVLLGDLGLSKDLAAASGLTVAAGTSGFAPPEQREGGGSVDRRADVWAASALVVWLIGRRPPDEGGAWERQARETGWPVTAVRALGRGLAPSPAKRHPEVDEWLAELEAGLDPPPASAPPAASPQTNAGIRGAPSTRRRRRLSAVVLVAALLLGGLAGVLLTGAGANGPEVRTEALAGERERSTVTDHGITIVLEGPTAIMVGEPSELTATVEGTDSWTWVGPDGALVAGETSFEVEAQTSGRATVRLLATDEQGRVVEATHQLRVL